MSLVPRRYFLNDMFDDFMPIKDDAMKCDIYEKNGDYHIEMDIPGYSKEDIKVEVNDDTLTIVAEKNEEINEEDKNYIHRERSYGRYQRTFSLKDLDSKNIDAEFNNGVLKITVPKKEETDNKKIIEIR